MGKHLIYTIAFDDSGRPYHQVMAKLMISSLYRTGYSGDILFLTNWQNKLYEFGRPGLKEVALETRFRGKKFHESAQRFKYNAWRFVKTADYDKVMFVDCDCLFLKSSDHLFRPRVDIGYSLEGFTKITGEHNNAYFTKRELETLTGPGINSGVWWVTGNLYRKIMRKWEAIDRRRPLRPKNCGDQPAWVRLLLDTKLKKKPFTYDKDIRYPFWERRMCQEFDAATVLHFCGASPAQKVSHMFGFYYRHFHGDTIPSLLSLLDG